MPPCARNSTALSFVSRLASRHRAWLACLLLAAGLCACAPLPSRLAGTPVAPEIGDALLADWRQAAVDLSSLQGLARVKAQTAEGSLNATQVLVASRPDRLRAETLSPFGTPLLLLAADGARLGVSVPSRGTFYTGVPSPENLGRFFRIPLQLEELIDVLLYRAPLPEAVERQVFTLEAGGWLMVRRSPGRHQELRFDDRRRLIEVRYYADGQLFLEVGYGGFADDERLPRQVAILLPELETSASLVFGENPYLGGDLRPELFQLAPPAGATIVSLDDL